LQITKEIFLVPDTRAVVQKTLAGLTALGGGVGIWIERMSRSLIKGLQAIATHVLHIWKETEKLRKII
jgi:hypothetical protein